MNDTHDGRTQPVADSAGQRAPRTVHADSRDPESSSSSSSLATLRRQCEQLIEKWRASHAHTYASENADLYRGFDNGCARCADDLEPLLALVDDSTQQLAKFEQSADHCGGCGGPYRFDTSVPSVLWNRVVRPLGGSEYLCPTCILAIFAKHGESFMAELTGDGVSGTSIEVRINGQASRAADEIQSENNRLRWKLREVETDLTALRASLSAQGPQWQPIERAPEGVDVLCYFPDNSEEYERMICHRLDGDWFQQDVDSCPEAMEEEPTHWMPIPNPPSAEGRPSDGG